MACPGRGLRKAADAHGGVHGYQRRSLPVEGRGVLEQGPALEQRAQVWHPGTRKWICQGIILSQANPVEEDEKEAHIARLYLSGCQENS